MAETPPLLPCADRARSKPEGAAPAQSSAAAATAEVVDVDVEEQASRREASAISSEPPAQLALSAAPPVPAAEPRSPGAPSSGLPSDVADEDDVVEEGVRLPAYRLRSRTTTPPPIVDIAEDQDGATPPHQRTLSDPAADVILAAELFPGLAQPPPSSPSLQDFCDDELQIVGEAPGALSLLFPFQPRGGGSAALRPGSASETEHPFFQELPAGEVPLIAPPLSIRLAALRGNWHSLSESTAPAGASNAPCGPACAQVDGGPFLDLPSSSCSSFSGPPRRAPLWAPYSAPLGPLRANGATLPAADRPHTALGDAPAFPYSPKVLRAPDFASVPCIDGSPAWPRQHGDSRPLVLHPSDPQVLVETLMAKLTCPICYRGFRRKRAMTAYSRQIQKRRPDLAAAPDSSNSQPQVLHCDDVTPPDGPPPVPAHPDAPLDGRHPGPPVCETAYPVVRAGDAATACLVSGRKKRKLAEDFSVTPRNGAAVAATPAGAQQPPPSSATSGRSAGSPPPPTGEKTTEAERATRHAAARWTSDDDDVVCTEVETSELRVGKCGHVYCEACIKRYLKVKKKCPVCNQPLLTRQLYPLFL